MVFLCPKRERERVRARKGKGKGDRERERPKAGAIIFLNHPGQNKKSTKNTVLYMEEQYSM